MDSLTQGILGATVAQLGFRQRIGRDATLVAGLAAALPDIDTTFPAAIGLLGLPVDNLMDLRLHRGVTHSLAIIPLYCFALAGLWWVARRRLLTVRETVDNEQAKPIEGHKNFWLLYGCVLAAVLTHPLLDVCTSYGTQLFAPFTSNNLPARYAWDCIGIVDIIYTPLLILTLLACWIVRKATPARSARITLIIGIVGFTLSVGYLAAGRHMHNMTVERTLRVAQQRGLVAPDASNLVRADAYPMVGTIFLWRGLLETSDGWVAARIHHFNRDDSAVRMQSVPKQQNPWIDKAMGLEQVQTFIWFTAGRARASYRLQDGRHRVTFHDMRYAPSADDPQSLWNYRVVFDEHGKPVEMNRAFTRREGGRETFAARAWADIWTP